LEALYGGRLACAVDAENAEDLAFGHGEPDVIDGDVTAVALGESLHLNHDRHGGSLPVVTRAYELRVMRSTAPSWDFAVLPQR
jgi:hypothetical protein